MRKGMSSNKFHTVKSTRMPCLLSRVDSPCMPFWVKIDIVSKYMYRDIGQNLLSD